MYPTEKSAVGVIMKLRKIKKRNPLKRDEEKFYLIPEYAGELKLSDLAEALSDACTLNVADITAVLEALTKRVPWYLENGFIIQLGAMGRLKLSISSKGQSDEKNLTAADVTKTRVIFTPSTEIKKKIAGTTFTMGISTVTDNPALI